MAFITPLKRFSSNKDYIEVRDLLQQKFDELCPLGCYKDEGERTPVITHGAEAKYLREMRLML